MQASKQPGRLVVTFAVVAHFIVTLLHGRAHSELGVGLNAFQQTFVLVVILLAPLVAMILFWLRQARLGLVLLLISMAGSLIFGLYFHYITVSNDHVSHLPPGDAQAMFRITAVFLVLTETFGVVVGLLGLRRLNVVR